MASERVEAFPGPRPFQLSDKHIFFGRDAEASELASLIISRQLVLLYSQSGAGKTSMLHAKIIPSLEESGVTVLGSVRVSGTLPPPVDPARIKNIFMYNALNFLQKDKSNPAPLAAVSLTEYLKQIPHTESEGWPSAPRVIIFDQFEELFTTSNERWKEREPFFEQLAEALLEDPRLRVVLGMREEYLAFLDTYAGLMPDRLRARFRLERLREEAAREAIVKPFEFANLKITESAANKLVTNLLQSPIKSPIGTVDISGEFVEPVQLQVVCRNLIESLPPGDNEIGESQIESYGDVDEALGAYYDACIAKAAAESRHPEGELRRWFSEKLITPDGLRSAVYKEQTHSGGLANEAVKILEDKYLIRTETRGGAPWYELTHDRFLGPIRKSNREWLRKLDCGKINGEVLEAAAVSWKEKRGALLPELQFDEAQGWRDSAIGREVGVSAQLNEFLRESQLALERAALKGKNAFLVACVGISILVIGIVVAAAIYIQSQRVEANNQRLSAEKAQKAEAIERERAENTATELYTDEANQFDRADNPAAALAYALRASNYLIKSGKEPQPELRDLLKKLVLAGEGKTWIPADDFTGDLSQDGKWLVYPYDRMLWLVDLEKAEVKWKIEGSFFKATFLSSSILALTSSDKDFRQQSVINEDYQLISVNAPDLPTKFRRVLNTSSSDDRAHITIRSAPTANVDELQVHHLNSKTVQSILLEKTMEPWVQLSPHGTYVCIKVAEKEVRIYSTTGKNIELIGSLRSAFQLEFSPDETLVLAMETNDKPKFSEPAHTLSVYSVPILQKAGTTVPVNSELGTMVWSANNLQFGVFDTGSNFHVFNAKDCQRAEPPFVDVKLLFNGDAGFVPSTVKLADDVYMVHNGANVVNFFGLFGGRKLSYPRGKWDVSFASNGFAKAMGHKDGRSCVLDLNAPKQNLENVPFQELFNRGMKILKKQPHYEQVKDLEKLIK